MNTDRWYYRVFQSTPDLIRALLPNSGDRTSSVSLEPEDPGDRHYRFEAPELKELNHRLDGVLWPRESTGCAETGGPEFPVVLLEVQMHRDTGFHHRLAAQTYRFLPQHPQVVHWTVLVITLPTSTHCCSGSELAIFGVGPVASMTMMPASSTTEHKPAPELFTYWREPDGCFLGYLNAYPDHWTQGDDLNDLKDHLLDLYHEFSRDDLPGIRKIGELVVA